jgi:hypothetical protein
MLLITSAVLALLPLLGIAWILTRGTITTVDGLFMSLILLAISGVFGMNTAWELRRVRRRSAWLKQNPQFAAQLSAISPAAASGPVASGIVQKVDFYEGRVGQPNKSVVILSNGASASRILVLEGDMRNRLPAGKRVELTWREENGLRTLLAAEHS